MTDLDGSLVEAAATVARESPQFDADAHPVDVIDALLEREQERLEEAQRKREALHEEIAGSDSTDVAEASGEMSDVELKRQQLLAEITEGE